MSTKSLTSFARIILIIKIMGNRPNISPRANISKDTKHEKTFQTKMLYDIEGNRSFCRLFDLVLILKKSAKKSYFVGNVTLNFLLYIIISHRDTFKTLSAYIFCIKYSRDINF